MDAVTYPENKVIEFINQHVVPLRVAFDSHPLAADLNVKWTPVLAILDQEGSAHQQTLGFFPPDELIPSIMLGIAKVHFDHDQYDTALASLHTLQADCPNSAAIPEAIYLEGVSRYKQGHEPQTLKEAYEQLQADFPKNVWTQRAYPYRLL
jgi:TolA-binding protein